MSKVVDELVSSVREAFNICVDNINTYEMWEDYDIIDLPAQLTPDEKMELIEKMNKIMHHHNWADLSIIIKEGKNASSIMIYVDDVSSWWRFEA